MKTRYAWSRIIWVIAVLLSAGICVAHLRAERQAQGPARGTPSPGPDDWKSEVTRLRSAGQSVAAIGRLREQYGRTRDPECLEALLGAVEDTGDALALVREARTFLASYPDNLFGRWMLARGLLFAAATDRTNPSAQNWIDEAEALAGPLEKAGYRPPDAPGAVAIVRMQAAFLHHRWEEADALAARALREGATSGKAVDIVQMRFDIALRSGRLEEARQFLEQAGRLLDGWKQQPVYYALGAHREELLMLREAFGDTPFTRADLDRIEADKAGLRRLGLIDPATSQPYGGNDLLEALRVWVALRDRGDTAGQLALLQKALDTRLPHRPRCFYGEALSLRPLYLNYQAGRLCQKLGKDGQARSYFQAALDAHPGHRFIEQHMSALGKPSI